MQSNQPSTSTAARPTAAAALQQAKKPGLPTPILSSDRCCTFKIAPEERRHRDFEAEQSKILKEIMLKTNTKIEVTTTKDGALNFCIIGKEANVQAAKNLVLQDFQTSVTLTVTVPKSIHGRLLGPKGARLTAIQDETHTKINIPRKEEDSEIIQIVGLKPNAEAAVRILQKQAKEFAVKSMDKVSVERIYLFFVTGPFNENLKKWEEMGAKVSTSGSFIPTAIEREQGIDEVTFTIVGEAPVVQQVKEEIQRIYEDKKKKCTTVNMEVKKSQHKYILGVKGQNLRNLFAKTGVSVELPLEGDSETITLRGERSKLGPALAELYTQAHSETDDFYEVENWLHKYLIGGRKTNYIDFKARGVDAKSLNDKILLKGPTTEVENVKDMFDAEVDTLRQTIVRKDVRVEPRIHGYIIGRSGTTVDQIREESGAYILVPRNDEPDCELIMLEGTAEAVAIAEEKINAIAKKYEASKKLIVDQQLLGSIIGRGGEKIRSIREKFSNIVFTFPDPRSKSNEITILGPTDEVEECYKYLEEFHQQLQESNHQAQVVIKNDIVKYLTDAQPAIKRIKIDHRVKIDLYLNDKSKAQNTATPQQQQADKSKGQTQQQAAPQNAKQKSVAAAATANTDNKTTTDKIGSNNSENIEPADKQSKKKNKNKNKQQTTQQQQQPQQSNGVPETKTAAADGKSSANKASPENYAIVTGKKEDVDLAKVKVAKLFDELATTIELEVKVAHKLKSSLGPKSRVYRQLLDDFQNKVVISFPPAQQQQQQQQSPKSQNKDDATAAAGGDVVTVNGNANHANETPVKEKKSKDKKDKQQEQQKAEERIDVVKIRGPKSLAKSAEKKFEQLITEYQDKLERNYQASVSIETPVIEKFVYADKIRLNKIRESQNVRLSIPDKRDTPKLNCTIVGYEKDVHTAMQEFTKLCKEVEERTEETIEIPNSVHPRLIGVQGRAVKKLMDDYKIAVKFARPGDTNSNAVTLTGSLASIAAAKKHMLKLADNYLASSGNDAGKQSKQANGNEGANNNNNNVNINNHNGSFPAAKQATGNTISNNTDLQPATKKPQQQQQAGAAAEVSNKSAES